MHSPVSKVHQEQENAALHSGIIGDLLRLLAATSKLRARNHRALRPPVGGRLLAPLLMLKKLYNFFVSPGSSHLSNIAEHGSGLL